MRVSVLLYEPGKENEGIHSLEIQGTTTVLMFEDNDDAQRYCGLLEAQDFPKPTVEEIDQQEIEQFCNEAGYVAKLVPKGFVPNNQEERLLIVPPESSLDVSKWQADQSTVNESTSSIDSDNNQELDEKKKWLEGLL